MAELIGWEDFCTAFPGVTRHQEGQADFLHIPTLKVVSDAQEHSMEALLRPMQPPGCGYTTRLFLERPMPNKLQNWTQHVVLGRQWHTPSFNNVPADLPLLEILANHLASLR